VKRMFILLSVITLATLLAAPAFAKNFNISEGASIIYWEGERVTFR
jgi:hypothetical protein